MQYEFAIVRKGYDKEQVEEYISELLATIERYKFKEEQTRDLVKLAEDKAKKIVEDAKDEAVRVAKEESDKIIDGAYSKLYSIQETMQEQRTLLNDFRKDYNRFILKYVNEVNKRNFVHLQTSVDTIETYINDTIKSAEQTKNGYFVPNPKKTDGPIIIVEPSESDVSSTKLQEHFVVDSTDDTSVKHSAIKAESDVTNTDDSVFFESAEVTEPTKTTVPTEKNGQTKIKEDTKTTDKNNANDLEITESEINTNPTETLDKEYDELFHLTKEETLSKHLEEKDKTEQVQEIQDTLLNIKPVK